MEVLCSSHSCPCRQNKVSTEPCLVCIQVVFEWTRETILKFQDITKGFIFCMHVSL